MAWWIGAALHSLEAQHRRNGVQRPCVRECEQADSKHHSGAQELAPPSPDVNWDISLGRVHRFPSLREQAAVPPPNPMPSTVVRLRVAPVEAQLWNSNLHAIQAGLANRLTLRAFDVAPTMNCVVQKPKRASSCRLGTSGLAGFVQAVQSPAAGQTVVDLEVPKEEVRESLHRYAGHMPRPGCNPLRLGGCRSHWLWSIRKLPAD